MTLRPGSPLPVPALDLPRTRLARDYDHATVAKRVRAGTWERVGRGAYLVASPRVTAHTHAVARIVAVHERLRTPHWFSHESAARIWGLPLWRDTSLVHVRQAGNASALRDRTVARHQGVVDERHLTLVGDLPVTDLDQTMVDCARLLRPLAGLVVADAALRAGADRTTALEMLAELAGHRGVARARAVIDLADDGAESPGETATRFFLLRDGLPRPQTQIKVVTHLGTLWSDLGWEEWRALVEYDGRVKYASREDLVHEKRREDALREAGYRPIRVVKEDLTAPSRLSLRAARLLPAGIPRTPRPLLRG